MVEDGAGWFTLSIESTWPDVRQQQLLQKDNMVDSAHFVKPARGIARNVVRGGNPLQTT
jgi:hypothetical protein